jgi:hypothetical protein
MKRELLLNVLIVLGIGCLAGCSSTESRIEDHPEIYGSLPPNQKEAVKEGKVIEGMNSDAVYLALGKPDHVVQGVEGNQTREYWVYTRLEPSLLRDYFSIPPSQFGPYPPGDLGPYYSYQEVPVIQIEFENRRVIGWQEEANPSVPS